MRGTGRGDRPSLSTIPDCSNAKLMKAFDQPKDARFAAGSCGDDCASTILVALFRGEELRLLWRTPPAQVKARFAIDWRNVDMRLLSPSWMGDTLAERPVAAAGDSFKVETSGFHLLQLDGPSDATFELCFAAK